MTTPDPGRSYTKRGFEENPDSKRDGDKGGGDDEDWEGSDRRKHRSSKSRKHSNTEESEEWDSGGKRKNIAERTDSKKKSGDSSRAGSGDDEDYDARKELRSKLVKKSQDFDEQGTKGNSGEKRDRTEKKSSGGYQDNNLSESSRKSRGVAGNKAHGRLDDDRTRRQGEKSLADETERNALRKTSLKVSSHENSQSKSRSKSENIREGELDKLQEKSAKRDPEILRNSEKKENSREKAQGTRVSRHDKEEHERNPHRKWDESDLAKKSSSIGDDGYLDKSDLRSGKASDKPGPSRDRILDPRSESRDVSPRSKTKAADLNNDKSRGRSETREVKSVRSSSREEKRVEGERSKNRGRSEVQEEDNKGSRLVATSREERLDGARDDKERRAREKFVGLVEDPESSSHRLSSKGHGEKNEKHRQQRDIDGESWERSINTDDDGHAERGRLRDRRDSNWEEFDNGGRSGGSTRSGRDVRRIKRSRSPEGSGRHHRQDSEEYDRGFSDERAESDNERSISLKGKDKERDVYREIRAKGRESAWSGRSRDWDVNKDHWKKKHHGRHDKDTKDGDGDFDHDKDWDSQRHDRERMDREKLHGRSGYRKERSREGTKNSSSFGMANENSDMIEIHPKSVDYFGREESMSAYGGRRNDVGSHPDFTSGASDEDWGYLPEDRSRMPTIYGQGDDSQERYADDGSPMLDQNMGMNSGRENFDIINNNMLGGRGRGQKVAMNSNRIGAGQMANGSQPPFGNNQGSGSFGRVIPQGGKAGRLGRGGRGRVTARDGQRVGLPMPIMGPPFGHLGLPPGPMQPIGPNMSPAPGPPMNPGIFVPPFGGPMVWAGARGVDMNMLAVNPGLSPVPPPGPPAPRFGPNMGTAPNPALYYNQLGPGRGVPPSMSGPGFANAMGPLGRGMPPDKPPMGWNPPRISGPPGKAPSRGEQNDYSQNFVDTGMRPQNFIRELELTSTVEDYPKLRELIQKKDEIVAKSSSPPMYYKCDLREHVLSPEFFGTKFDVILVDPPWEEYAHRAPGVADNMECWTFEEIQNLKIEAIADTPSFIFLWVGDGLGLEQGRLCLKKWGFRRCEDICWVKTNKGNATPGLRHDSHTLFQHSKEHCLMGIKGTVRRSTDGHIIHANIDTDIIIAEEPAYGSTTKPEDLYRIIEHFSLGRRRIELFGEDHNIRSGWLTVGKGLTSSNFNAEAYCRNFADKDGKVWQGGGGRNPPPDAPHLVLTTPDIESLRPKSPPAKNQQQQSTSLSTTANSTVKRSSGNSPQNASAAPPMLPLNQEATSSNNVQGTMPWASPIGLKGLDTGNVSDDKFFDNYAFNPSCGQVSGEHPEFEAHRAVNLL